MLSEFIYGCNFATVMMLYPYEGKWLSAICLTIPTYNDLDRDDFLKRGKRRKFW